MIRTYYHSWLTGVYIRWQQLVACVRVFLDRHQIVCPFSFEVLQFAHHTSLVESRTSNMTSHFASHLNCPIRLGSSTGKLTGSSIYSLASYSNGIEAPGIFKYGSYYYLFVRYDHPLHETHLLSLMFLSFSRDKCCDGLSSTYNIRVGRATSITGPYLDSNGVNMLNSGGTLVLESHGSVCVLASSLISSSGSS